MLIMIHNNMINGTKLLNVAGMTRGRRDGILKSEKMCHVVGLMHLKGAWYELLSQINRLFKADVKKDPFRSSSGFWKRSQSHYTHCLSTILAPYSIIPPTRVEPMR